MIEDVKWGIDLGGTKTEGVIIRVKEGLEIIDRYRIPTEREKGYNHILEKIQVLVEEMCIRTGLRPAGVGVCTPGTLDPQSQTLKNSNTTCLNGQPIRKDLQQLLGIPVRIANDANCFVLAETHLGTVKKKYPHANTIFGVIMGTGVGGGIVINGEVLAGLQGIGGEWGHNYLDASGGACYCGKIGCVETVLSGTALQKYYREVSGNELNLKEIVRMHEKGKDPVASETIERLIHFFGVGMSVVINILDPDVILLGGGVGNIDLLYSEGLRSVEKYIFNNRSETVFLKPVLGDSAGVFGAALL